MKGILLSQVAQWCEGVLIGADVTITQVQRDSRHATQGDLFLALTGERFDAHDFVADVLGKASAALVSRHMDMDLPQVVVSDVRLALGHLSANWRNQFDKPIVALTGSNGKTTLKEMLTSILSEQGQVMATQGNLNNDLGVPLTLLRLQAEHDFAVVEMGANHAGEIAYLTRLARPDIAILNNAGAAHLAGFGDIDGVARAKGEIFENLHPQGIAIINADDDYADYWRGLNQGRMMISFGMDNVADVHGKLSADNELIIHCDQGNVALRMSLLGRHNAMNALAATAAALALGITFESIKHGLEQLHPVKGRLAPCRGARGALLIDDTYNANPSSTNAAIKVLASLTGRKLLILGDMGELGDESKLLHQAVGEFAAQQKIDAMFGLGAMSQVACQAFGKKGYGFLQLADLLQALQAEDLGQNTVVLVKGSRSARMERVVQALMQPESSALC